MIPKDQLNLSAGVLQGVQYLSELYSLEWIVPVIAIFIAYGAFTSVIILTSSPSKGIQEAAQNGYLPNFLQKKNKYGMPIGALLSHSTISSIISLVIIFMPSVSGAFWIMSALSAQLYIIMYILMFASVIKLRYSHADIKRSYKIPGGKLGLWMIVILTCLTLMLAVAFSFIPTDAIREKGIGAIITYVMFLLMGIIIFTLIPLIICYKKTHKS